MKQEIIRKLSAAVAMSLVVGVSLAACGGSSSSTAADVTKTGSADGFGGAVTATLTVDANGTVTDCKLEGAQETESIGGVALDPALAPGQWRELTAEEVERLRTR